MPMPMMPTRRLAVRRRGDPGASTRASRRKNVLGGQRERWRRLAVFFRNFGRRERIIFHLGSGCDRVSEFKSLKV